MSNLNVIDPDKMEIWVCQAFCDPDTKPHVANWLTSTLVKWMLRKREFLRPVLPYEKRKEWLAGIVAMVEADFVSRDTPFPEQLDENGLTVEQARQRRQNLEEEERALFDMRPYNPPQTQFFGQTIRTYTAARAEADTEEGTPIVDLYKPLTYMPEWISERLSAFFEDDYSDMDVFQADSPLLNRTLRSLRNRAPLFVKLEDSPAWVQKRIAEGTQLWAVAHADKLSWHLNHQWFHHAVDFLQTLPEGQIKYTVEDLADAVAEWDKQMAQLKIIEKMNEGCELVHTLADSKWTVWQLKDRIAFQNEGDALGHCVAGYYGRESSMLFSIRLEGRPKATIEIEKKYRAAVQIRGTKNHFPSETTREKIEEWLAHARYSVAEMAYTKSFGVENEVEDVVGEPEPEPEPEPEMVDELDDPDDPDEPLRPKPQSRFVSPYEVQRRFGSIFDRELTRDLLDDDDEDLVPKCQDCDEEVEKPRPPKKKIKRRFPRFLGHSDDL